MWKYILPAAVIFVVFIMLRSWRFSKRIFTDEHYIEVAEALLKLRKTALDNMRRGDKQSPNGTVTSAGLALSYSIDKVDGGFYHHVAVSTPNRRTLHAIGDHFVYYSIWVLGLPTDRFRLEASQTSVHHGKVTISQDEQQDLFKWPRNIPSLGEIKDALKECARNRPRCHEIKVEGI